MQVLSGRENRILRLLCDANVIIKAHSINSWHYLTSTHQVFTGSVVASKECVYYADEYQKRSIDLKGEVKKGRLTILATATQEVAGITKKVAKNRIIIHPGEAELIALMLNSQYGELVFCTADKAAVHAAYIFDLTSRLVSLERCIRKHLVSKLPYQCTEQALNHWKAEAIQRFGTKN